MCLAIPALVTQINSDQATVSLNGIQQTVSLALVEDIAVGDYVIIHVGYALGKLDPIEAEKTLALFASEAS